MKLNRRGLIATIIYHSLLLVLLIFAGLTFPDPPPEEEGILVNFGTDDTGFGQFEPRGDDQNQGDPELPVMEQSQELPEVLPEPVQEPVEQYTPPDPTPVDNTQDVEEVKVKEEAKPTPEELERQRQEELRIERERQERLERERIERERREEEERQRLEQERIAREQRERQQEISNRAQNAFGRQGVGETDGSQGITQGDGNQGVTTGSPDADRYGTGGGLGDGIDYGLGSRKAVGNLPKPNVTGCEVTSRIEVKVEITVNRQGIVEDASVLNATFQDQCIWEMVVKAARQSRFSLDNKPPLSKKAGSSIS